MMRLGGGGNDPQFWTEIGQELLRNTLRVAMVVAVLCVLAGIIIGRLF